MDYGKILKLSFDGKVYNVSPSEKARYRLVNAYGEHIYPGSITYGQNDHEVYLHFENINNLVFPAHLECLQALKMGSEYISFGAFVREIFLDNLHPVPGNFSYICVGSVEVSGNIEIEVVFDGKMYSDDHVDVFSVLVSGASSPLAFLSKYLTEDKYVNVASVSVSGQYSDINGNPI